MNAAALQKINGWLDKLLARGREVKTIEVTEKALELGLYDDAEKHQAMIEGLNQRSREMIKNRSRFHGRSYVASKGVFNERAYKGDKFLSSDEIKERHVYFSTRHKGDGRQAAYWARLHGRLYQQVLPLTVKLSAEDEQLVNEWVDKAMQ